MTPANYSRIGQLLAVHVPDALPEWLMNLKIQVAGRPLTTSSYQAISGLASISAIRLAGTRPLIQQHE